MIEHNSLVNRADEMSPIFNLLNNIKKQLTTCETLLFIPNYHLLIVSYPQNGSRMSDTV